MTATQPVPNSGTHPRMASDADSQPDPPVPAPTAAVRAAPGLWSKLTDNPLLTILGTATVGLLIFTLTRTEHRISRLEDSVHAGSPSSIPDSRHRTPRSTHSTPRSTRST